MTNPQNTQRESANVRLSSDDSNLKDLLLELKCELDPIHMKDPELHQLWIEVQWMESNLRSKDLCMPRKWEPIVFRMAKGRQLALYPNAQAIARDLCEKLRAQIPPCQQ